MRKKLNDRQHPKILLVEGNNDLHVVSALCARFRVAKTFDIQDCEGIGEVKNDLREAVDIHFDEADIQAIGVLVDADESLPTQWQSLHSLLKKKGFSPPEEFPKEGLILKKADAPVIGIWIMPNNQLPGMIEDFIKLLIPEGDLLSPVVADTLKDLEKQGLNRYKRPQKAFIHTWLAWQEDPGTPMGLAITKKYLTTDTETCTAFVAWLNRLFNPAD